MFGGKLTSLPDESLDDTPFLLVGLLAGLAMVEVSKLLAHLAE